MCIRTFMVYVCQLLHSEHMHTNVPQSVYVRTFVVDQNKGDLCEPNELLTQRRIQNLCIQYFQKNVEGCRDGSAKTT